MSCRGRKKSLIFAYRVPEIAIGGEAGMGGVSKLFLVFWFFFCRLGTCRLAGRERLVGGQDRTDKSRYWNFHTDRSGRGLARLSMHMFMYSSYRLVEARKVL